MGDEMKQAETGMPSLTLEPDFCTGSEEGAGSAGTRTTDGSCTGNGSGPAEDGTDSTDTGRTENGK